MNTRKVRAYFDAFNLYHAIDKLGQPELKWLNLWTVAANLLRPGETLDEVHFFTAVWPYDQQKQRRHKQFIAALDVYGVKIHPGKFSKPKKWCEKQGQYCPFREEKQTDVAIAVKMLADALSGEVSRMILVTADSDQIPTAKAINAIEGISLTLAFPPGREGEARELGELIPDRFELHAQRLKDCKLPRTVKVGEKVIATMPALYRGDLV